MKIIDEMKETIYEHENKISEQELGSEEQKNNYEDLMINFKKDLTKSRDSELDLSKKYELLKKR